MQTEVILFKDNHWEMSAHPHPLLCEIFFQYLKDLCWLISIFVDKQFIAKISNDQ